MDFFLKDGQHFRMEHFSDEKKLTISFAGAIAGKIEYANDGKEIATFMDNMTEGDAYELATMLRGCLTQVAIQAVTIMNSNGVVKALDDRGAILSVMSEPTPGDISITGAQDQADILSAVCFVGRDVDG